MPTVYYYYFLQITCSVCVHHVYNHSQWTALLETSWCKLKLHQFLHVIHDHQVCPVSSALFLRFPPGHSGAGQQVATALEGHPSFPTHSWFDEG